MTSEFITVDPRVFSVGPFFIFFLSFIIHQTEPSQTPKVPNMPYAEGSEHALRRVLLLGSGISVNLKRKEKNKTMIKQSEKLKKLIICALMIAVANVLSFAKIDMPMGGGMTVCSMVPLVFTAFVYGPKWGLSCAFVYSVFQMLFGLDNVAYATNAWMAVLIILFDYIVAYAVIGLVGFFGGKNFEPKRIIPAAIVTLTLRFVCHFITGWFVWDALWPNEFGLSPALYSLCYNGIYMLPEIITTSIASYFLVSSKQITDLVLYSKKKSSEVESQKSGDKMLIIIGILFLIIQAGAYVGLYFTDSLAFFMGINSFKSALVAIWDFVTYNLVGVIGIIFLVFGIARAKKK